jgi:hypothetical protein
MFSPLRLVTPQAVWPESEFNPIGRTESNRGADPKETQSITIRNRGVRDRLLFAIGIAWYCEN